jgi:hypothetical protein
MSGRRVTLTLPGGIGISSCTRRSAPEPTMFLKT